MKAKYYSQQQLDQNNYQLLFQYPYRMLHQIIVKWKYLFLFKDLVPYLVLPFYNK